MSSRVSPAETKTWCKQCGKEVDNTYVIVIDSGELVVADEQFGHATVLDRGDRLCDKCNRTVTFYRRVK